MERTLSLSERDHKLIWERREAIQAKFRVQIESPFACGKDQPPENWRFNGFSASSFVMILVKGQNDDVAAMEKYVTEVFINPAIIQIFSYHQDLAPIFGNIVWIRIFEEIYNVYIARNSNSGCELDVGGTESCVRSATSFMEQLVAKYNDCKDTQITNNENSLAQKLVCALKACKLAQFPARTFNAIPNDVITLLLSLLEKTYKEHFPLNDEVSSLDDSVLIVDAPETKADISVIVLDSDSDHDSNQKPQKISKKKRKKLRKAENSKKRNLILCDLDPQSGSNAQKHLPQENGDLQNPKVESTIDKSQLPVIENPDFIPLSLESAGTSSEQPVPTNPCLAEEKESVEVVPEAPRRLRPIIIDGSNVAFYSTPGRWEDFSWKRIEKCMQYFLDRGHTDVKIFLPNYRRPICYEKSGNQVHIENLENQQLIVFTPSRKIEGRTVICYDDRFIVDYASRTGGVIVSNDNYRDIMNENEEWAKAIKSRLLMYVFAGDELMIPEDPLGPRGPRLNDFLSFPPDAE